MEETSSNAKPGSDKGPLIHAPKEPSFNALLKLQLALMEHMNKFVSNTRKQPLARRTHGYYLGRVNGWHDLWEKFSATDRSLTSLRTDKDEDKPYFKENHYDKFEELFFDFKGELVDKLSTFEKNHAEIGEQNRTKADSSTVQLPTITLPKFSGNYADWVSFRDLFNSLIDSNTSLASVQKLHYLKANVVGNAAKVIRQYNITNENYKSAWRALTDRYENKRVLISTQLRALTSQPKINNESANAIKAMIDTTTECLASLGNLEVSVAEWGPLLIHLLTQKLPAETHKAWEEKISDTSDYPAWETLKSFLETRFRTLEALSEVRTKENPPHKKQETGNVNIQSFYAGQITCKVCQEKHSVRSCKSFLSSDPPERLRIAKSKGYCINCLGEFHSIKKCLSKSRCAKCRGKHHTLLHLPNICKPEPSSNTQPAMAKFEHRSESERTPEGSTRVAAHFINDNHPAMLATAEIEMEGPSGIVKGRALIDPGSQVTFITAAIVSQLNLETKSAPIVVTGVEKKEVGNFYPVTKARRAANVTILSTKDPSRIPASAYVLETLTDLLPSVRLTKFSWDHLENLDLADPSFNIPARVDMIIGADIYPLILCDGVRKGPRGTPVGQNTIFGWILTGKTYSATNRTTKVRSYNITCSIEDQLKKFWEVEEVSLPKKTSTDEQRCEEIYKTTHRRNPDGSYVVRLPIKEDGPELGESRLIALKRYLSTERNNERKEVLKEYNKVLKEYITSGHMVEVPISTNHSYYLPHHAVIKPSSTTTKLRVVFDASCKSSNGKSLNDNLLVGPTLQHDITLIILKWRHHRYVFTADIEKMYRQIFIHPDDSQFQRILWRDHLNSPIKEYALKTVTFGVNCAPYLAIRTLQQLAEDERINFPRASRCLINDFYVDDVLTGGDTIEETKSLQAEITALLAKGHFPLRKFASNDSRILEHIPNTSKSEEALKMQFSEDTVLKALGIYWDPKADEFQYKVALNEENNWTKRRILSTIAKLFDPLGWVSPIIVQAKIFMQRLWITHTDWDEKIPEYLRSDWINFISELPHIEQLRIPRWVNSYTASTIELHGFCDSSEKAYAAAVYLRVLSHDNDPIVHLLVSKTKVAPIKTISLPRLELCGAVLLSKLIKSLRESYIKDCKTILWTDSTIVLSWIRSLPHRWKSFVANRITEIIENSGNADWRHVPSESNPADLASRGVSPLQLKDHCLWWRGPSWLIKPESEWPKEPHSTLTEDHPEEKKKLKTFHLTTTSEHIIERFSNLTHALRIIAYCRRFVDRCRKLKAYPNLVLVPSEIHKARQTLIRVTQMIAYSSEIECLKANQRLPRKSSLLALNPFLDDQRILRVGGRLEHSELPFEEKHPIILPHSDKFSDLLVEQIHKDTLHGGIQLTLYTLRQTYWIPRVKHIIKRKIHQCTTCSRWRNEQTATIMGQLPADRITPCRPFTCTGTDYAGPVLIKTRKTRNAPSTKGYIAVFVCLVTKATHLELVSDLTSECFLAALRRFFSRRGLSKKIFSDNGTNFVGAKKILNQEMDEFIRSYQQIAAELYANKGVEWHFIPPRAPHFGGLWEAAVKSMKHHLRRTVGQTLLTFEELTTLLTQIEAIMNSRPLCALSSDHNDINPLSPGHFLVGSPLLSLPEKNYEERNISYLSRWRLIQKMRQDFWKRWSAEYLHHLQQRPKWKEVDKEFKVGDRVILKEEGSPPSYWKLARVIETFPGRDNITRVVRVKTSSGEFKRPISKLAPLPLNAATPP